MSESAEHFSRYGRGMNSENSSLYERCTAVAQNFAPKESDRKGEGSAKSNDNNGCGVFVAFSTLLLPMGG